MNALRYVTRPVSYLVTAGILALSLPVAHAAMVGTEATINTTPIQQDRTRVPDALNRDEVKAKLLSLGADPAHVQARVDALTGSEALMLSQHLDQMPAGGNTVNLLLVILLLILIF
ncbi:MAG: hypothetical protein FD165_2367 [Gammaproteobacteria bacterium]|nr:MAG: hypothetical protein FD165_2367 [Gammaproteobacteria bacterium]TND01956.1 MAG: hypothetical protein FD120_2484 [Gammaproteobacteria bacterium]